MTASEVHRPRPQLSVAMIVRNEQETLAESIRSVRSIADEIVVADTGSTDKTVAVARQLGAKTVKIPWTDDFSAARNQCLRHVTGPWVLWLDAGERLEGDWARGLRQFLDQQADVARAYMLMVQVPAAGPDKSVEQVAQLRLVPNHPGLRFEGRVRETLFPSIEVAGLQVDAIDGRIVRHPRQHDPARKSSRAQRDLTLAALEIADHDGSAPARLRLAMGDAYSNLGAMESAREAYLAALEAAEHGSTEMLEAYYGLVTTYDGDLFLADMQLNACLEALEVFPLDAQLLLAMGNYLQGKGRLDLAARAFDAAVKFGQVNLEVWHLEDLPEVAATCLALTLQTLDRDDEARSVLDEALRRYPVSGRLQRHLLELHIKHGRCDEAIELADGLSAAGEDREPLHNAVRGACRAAQKDWAAALAYLQSAYVAGCNDPLCLRWLSVTLLSNGQVEAARPVLEEWQRIEPNNPELLAYLAAAAQSDQGTPAVEEPSMATPGSEPSPRRWRIDPGTTILEASPPLLPIITQISSAEMGSGYATEAAPR